jgi:hypothetical protein
MANIQLDRWRAAAFRPGSEKAVFDVVIVNYNSTTFLMGCLKTIFKSKRNFPVNVFVYDNASIDDPDQIVDFYPSIHYTKSAKNIGFTRAVNKLLRQGRAPYVILLNPDTTVSESFFEQALRFSKENGKTGVMGPKVLDEQNKTQGSARAFPTPLTALFGRNSPLTKIFPNNAITKANILNIKGNGRGAPLKVDWVSGACMVVRRKVIAEVGMLDQRFFMYWEDADWCRRIKEAGWEIIYYPKAVVRHFTAKSSDTNPYFSIYHFHRSGYHLFQKYSRRSVRLLAPLTLFILFLRCIFAMSVYYVESRKKGIRKGLGTDRPLLNIQEDTPEKHSVVA